MIFVSEFFNYYLDNIRIGDIIPVGTGFNDDPFLAVRDLRISSEKSLGGLAVFQAEGSVRIDWTLNTVGSDLFLIFK